MLFAQPKIVVGLDVGSYSVKAVAVQPTNDRITLQGYAQARIDNQDVTEVIRRVLDQLGVKARKAVTSVSGRSVIVRQVETPRLSGEELRAHITYEADKYIPFGSEEVVIDAQPLPERAGTKAGAQQEVMLVAVRKSFVLDHVSSLKAAGIVPAVVDVDVFALANAYELLGPPQATDGDQAKKATALIDIGASKSNIAIVQANRVLFTREVYLAGNEITDAIARTFNEPAEDVERIKLTPGETLDALVDAAMPAFEDLANEIRLSFDYVEGKFDAEVGTVVLTGGSSQLPNIADILGNILGRPVHIFDPLAGLDLVPSKYDIHALDANSPALTVALGLAAHLLEGQRGGLGNAQSHAWQPRGGNGTSSRAGAPAGPGTVPTPKAPSSTATPLPPPPILTAPPSAYTPPVPSSILPPPPAASMLPPPPAAPLAAPPAVSNLVSPPPGGDLAADIAAVEEEDARRHTTATLLNDKNKTALLVVLDDEQEMPQSERIQKPVQRKSQVLQMEGFKDDDQGTDLPDLPKL